MRYLILGIALLAMTASFAAQSASTDITLTVQNYCAITADAANVPVSVGGNSASATVPVAFHYTANNACHVTPTIVENNPQSGLVWTTEAAAAHAAGVSVPLTINAYVSGITPSVLAGAYTATLTASISIP